MKLAVEDVVRDALKLDEEERAEVAAQLLDSLEQADLLEEEAWLAELERRATELESGAVQGIPWEELRETLLHGRSGSQSA